MSKTLFKIENGKIYFKLVDTAAVGYDPAWQCPAGKVLPAVTAIDYDATTGAFACQVVTGQITATENTTTENIDGTWCDPPEVAQIVGADSFAVAWDLYQDPTLADGVSAYLYQHRQQKAYVYVDMGGNGVPPIATGVVTLKAATIGGGRTANRAQVTFPFDRAPDVQFGTAADWLVVFGDQETPPVPGGSGTTLEASTVPAGETAAA